MAETLQVKIRPQRGKLAMRRLRATGQVPAILYGHGLESVSISVGFDAVQAGIRQGAKLFDLRGELEESALLREVQWDGLGSELLHIDFTRVDATEMVTTAVAIELRGEAPGTHSGGIVDQPLHELEIECPAASIPDRFVVNINSLEIDGSITAGEIELPSGGKLLTEPHQLVVQCTMPVSIEEEEGEAAEGAEPEVIGKKEEGEEEDS